MAERTIRSGIGTYLRPDGQWTHGMLGDVVDVHEDDIERFDRLNPAEPAEVEATEAEREFPLGDPAEDWSNKELDAYADAHGIDIKAAKNKAEKLAAFAAAASA